jgi:K+-sensing histidine kinase KdpD
MAHQIKTPLNAILGFTESLLASESFGNAEREAVATINRSGKNMLEMVNDILDIEKIQTGRLILETQSVDVAQLLENARITVKSKLEEHNASLHMKVKEGTPRFIIIDEKRFRQILLNFLNEAIELNKNRAIFLTLKTKKDLFIWDISNEAKPDGHHALNSHSFEPVFDPHKMNLKPALVVASLLVQLMGGIALTRKKSGHPAGYHFHVNLGGTQNGEAISDHFPDWEGNKEDFTGEYYDISGIPDNLRHEMLDAVKRVRFDIFSGLMTQIEGYDPKLAKKLQSLAKNYNYESILKILGRKI